MTPKFQIKIPHLTTTQMIEVDRLMIEKYQIELIQMMENAGRNLAILAREYFFKNRPLRKRMFILAGTGGNGGGALVCARHLANYGAEIYIQLSKNPASMKPIPHHQLTIIQQMGVPFTYTNLPSHYPI